MWEDNFFDQPGVTQLIRDAQAGDDFAVRELFFLLYNELRKCAIDVVNKHGGRKVPVLPTDLFERFTKRHFFPTPNEQASNSLDHPTEDGPGSIRMRTAFRKLQINDRKHFYNCLAKAMSWALVDMLRERQKVKQLPINNEGMATTDSLDQELSELEKLRRAFDKLEQVPENQLYLEILRQHHYLGHTQKKLAVIFGFTDRTIRNKLRYAEALINEEIAKMADDESVK